MKTIAISLQKGGSGKTSLAVSPAAELAGRGACSSAAIPRGTPSRGGNGLAVYPVPVDQVFRRAQSRKRWKRYAA